MLGLSEEFEQRKAEGLFRQRQLIESAQGANVEINGDKFLNFNSNDYLGFANSNELKNHMIEAVNQYGVGASSSQLLAGYLAPHKLLEEKLSRFLNREAALVFSSGYLANLAIASALIDTDTIVLQDKLNHASLVDSALLSKGKLVRYRHNDIQHLKSLLEKHKKHKLLLMTDAVFSMDGDCAKLEEIVSLCKTYNVLLVVDDAHGLGVLGEAGGGLLEKLNIDQQQVPLLIGTFGKAFGASGAFVSGSRLHIEAFVQKARTYIYTTSLLPSVAAAMTHAIDMVINAEELRDHLNKLVVFYKRLCRESNINLESSAHHIQPLIIGDAHKAVAAYKFLYENKILVSAIRPPTVAKNTSRLRISITAAHTKKQIEQLVNALKDATDKSVG